jgi:hypothetical protein
VFRGLIIVLLTFPVFGLFFALLYFLIWFLRGEISSLNDIERFLQSPFDRHSMLFVDRPVWGFVVCILGIYYVYRLLNRFIPGGPYTPKEDKRTLASGIISRGKATTFSFATEQRRKRIVLDHLSQGIYIEGSAGSGKSNSVIEPIIYQAASKGFSGFLYDFKGNPPTLSSCMYGAIVKSKISTRFAHINLSCPSISNRCNPLSPSYLPYKQYAHEYASAILKNLNREWASKLDFWAENAIAYLSAILWYLKKHHPLLCSLPHATLLALEAPEKSIALLNQDEETKRMIGAIGVAYYNNADKQIAGIFSSLQLPINKLYTKEIFWILSSSPNDVGHISLDVSNPSSPTLLSVANDPRLSDVFSPIISLIATVCIKNMNQQGKHKSVFILDEAPTLFIPGLEHLPATARANEVATVLCVQDFAQLQKLYGQKLAESIRNNLGNQFFGMTNNLDTAEYITKMAGEYTQVRTSVSESSQDWSETVSLGKEHYLTAHQVSTQPPGHFITKVTGKTPRFFAAQLKAHRSNMKLPDQIVPETKLATLVEEKWQKIHQEVKAILAFKVRS